MANLTAQLTVAVLVAEKAKGSWKAIAEQAERVLGHTPMEYWTADNKKGLMARQEALSLLQPDFERGIHPTDRRYGQYYGRYSNHIKIQKGDWFVLTTFGSLILTDAEYKEFVR